MSVVVGSRTAQQVATIVAYFVNLLHRYPLRVAKDRSREEICSAVARIIKAERMARNLSLNQLAKHAGLSRQMVAYVEQEERNPSLDTLLRLAEVLEIPLDEILKRARTKGK